MINRYRASRSSLCLNPENVLSLWCFYRESLWLRRFLLVGRMWEEFYPSSLCEWKKRPSYSWQIILKPVGFCPYAYKNSTDSENLWGRGCISLEAILVLPKNVVNSGFYAVVLYGVVYFGCYECKCYTSVVLGEYEVTLFKERGKGSLHPSVVRV